MIGWAIKRGFQGATGASGATQHDADDADTTQIEAPDTPAPVFAARAVRHAIFGTPAPAMRRTSMPADSAAGRTRSPMKSPAKSPSKPPGILLTPGAAASRRKRVSFGHEVKAKHDVPSPTTTERPPPRGGTNSTTTTTTTSARRDEHAPAASVSDGEWEDDDGGDVTIDLNEPKSSSGNYWKSQFTKYHEDAREEMAKLVKHKHLAKLYAQQKDAENTQLLDRVKDLERQLQAKDNELELAQSLGSWGGGGGGGARSSSPAKAEREAEREIARLNREVEMLKRDNDSLRRENETLKATDSPGRSRAPRPSAPATTDRAATAARSSAPITADRAAAARERIAQRRRERMAAKAA